MNSLLRNCLQDLEARIVPDEEERLLHQWREFAEGRFAGDVFRPTRQLKTPPRTEWPTHIRVNAALDDFDQMALQQYAMCSMDLANGKGLINSVRANYGTSILPSLFGVKLFIMDDEMNTLPTSWPVSGTDAIEKLVAAGVPDLEQGWGAKVFEMGRRFQAIAQEYPKIGKYIKIYHPDLQGPMDVCEVVWGSSVFYALIEMPDLVKAFLELITETYTRFMHKWEQIVPFDPQGHTHWGLYYKGTIMLRDDSAMNMSPEMFDEFIRPYDQRLLDEFNGGAIHFCGRGDHFISSMGQMNGLYAIQMSQPELNDMETIFQNTIDKGVNLLNLSAPACDQALAQGRPLHGRVTCCP